MAWDTELIHAQSELHFAVSSGLTRTPDSIFAGFFLKDPATIDAIQKRNPVIFDILESMLNYYEGLEAIYALDDFSNNYHIQGLTEGIYDTNKVLQQCQDAESSPLCEESTRAIIKCIRDALKNPTAFKMEALAQRKSDESSQQSTKSGYVYFLQWESFYKIGATQDVNRRLEQLSTKPPFDAVLIHSITTDDIYGLESELHEHFADKRKNGEWFLLNEEDVEYIKGL